MRRFIVMPKSRDSAATSEKHITTGFRRENNRNLAKWCMSEETDIFSICCLPRHEGGAMESQSCSVFKHCKKKNVKKLWDSVFLVVLLEMNCGKSSSMDHRIKTPLLSIPSILFYHFRTPLLEKLCYVFGPPKNCWRSWDLEPPHHPYLSCIQKGNFCEKMIIISLLLEMNCGKKSAIDHRIKTHLDFIYYILSF